MRSSLITALVVIIAIAIAWLGVWPLYQDVAGSRTAVDSLEQSVQAERDANARLERLAAEITERQDAVGALEEAVSKEKDSATLIAVYEEAAVVNGLLLNSIEMHDQERGEGARPAGSAFESVASTIELAGTYPAFASFLTDVERSFPLVDIAHTSFSLADESSPEGVSENPEYNFTVTLTSYHLK